MPLCETDPMQQALAQCYESRQIEITMARAREQKAYELVKKAEDHLRRVYEFWEARCTELRMLEPGD